MAVAPLLQQAGTHAPRARLMVDGQQWVAGDFTVRLGAVTSNSEYRGTLVQVSCPVQLPSMDGGRPCAGACMQRAGVPLVSDQLVAGTDPGALQWWLKIAIESCTVLMGV